MKRASAPPGLGAAINDKRSEVMWLWESELRELGLRSKADRYWQGERRFGLPLSAHLSVYAWSEQVLPGAALRLVELSAFHVTFEIGLENIHFYYHENLENEWQPGGHTSRAEIRRLGCDLRELRETADTIAAAFVAALKGVYQPRGG